MAKTTQCERIKRHLRHYGSITSKEAMEEYGIYRLASRITDLKKSGENIQGRFKTSLNRYGEPVSYKVYFIPKEGATDGEPAKGERIYTDCERTS